LAILQLYNASKSFGNKQVIKEVSLSCETGEIIGLFGRNGSGKSTLLKMLFGTVKSDFIKMSINGELINPSEVISEKRIAYLPQQPFVPKNTKIRDIIPMYFYNEKQQDAVFYNPGVAKITHKKPKELSLGELRYFEVILIGNLMHDFILLDEPFSMIEPLYKDAIKEFLLTLQPKKGIIITDHYYDDVLQTTTKNIIISEGKTTEILSKKDLVKMEYLSKNS
jgi:ABC-type multidrug transport system ATPase subunit